MSLHLLGHKTPSRCAAASATPNHKARSYLFVPHPHLPVVKPGIGEDPQVLNSCPRRCPDCQPCSAVCLENAHYPTKRRGAIGDESPRDQATSLDQPPKPLYNSRGRLDSSVKTCVIFVLHAHLGQARTSFLPGQPGGVIARRPRPTGCPFPALPSNQGQTQQSAVRRELSARSRKGQRPHTPRQPLSAGIEIPRKNRVGVKTAGGFNGTVVREV